MKYILIYLGFLSIMALPHVVKADSYELYLFYDIQEQELRLDRFVQNPIELVQEDDFISYNKRLSEEPNRKMKVILEAYDSTFPAPLYYEAQNGDFLINIPFFPHVKEVRIQHPEAKNELQIDVSQYAQCNQNTTCEVERGENSDNCPADCTPQQNTFTELEEEVSTRENEQEEQGRVNWQIIVGIACLCAGIGFGVYKFLKKII